MARHRYDRSGERVDAEDDQADRHDCRDGWAGEDHAGRPVPCLVCRPHLRRRRADPTNPLTGWTATKTQPKP